MTVDIIIPTYKPDETLCLLLHKLQGQTFVVHRVIILNTEEKLWKQAAAAYPIEQVLKELPCEYEVPWWNKAVWSRTFGCGCDGFYDAGCSSGG